MPSAVITPTNSTWFCAGREVFPAMIKAIEGASESVRLETYTFTASPLGEGFRRALIQARGRGVQVLVLIDGLGSSGLPEIFWEPLRAVGGEVRTFNPWRLHRLGIRNHRKSLVCDRRIAFVGGFNIAPEYEGDGINCGWCDLGLKLEGSLAEQLALAFDDMFERASFDHKFLDRLRQSGAKRAVVSRREQLLLSGPGRGRNPIKRALRSDLAKAREVQIMMAYFLPTWRIRRQLGRVARNGGRVQLILAGKSDVRVSHLAGQSLYRRLLKAGVEISEYQPQILHAKLIIIDNVVYVGSANLDPRSLNINYELMIRFESKEMADQAREVFATSKKQSQQITIESWRRSRTLWRRFKQHWSYFLLVRIDPYIARRQWQALPD